MSESVLGEGRGARGTSARTGKRAMERFWKTVRMPKAVPERREDSESCTARGTEGQITAAIML